MTKIKTVFIFLSIALLLTIISLSTAAPVRTPGVGVGDTFTYGEVSFYWYSDDPDATGPAEWEGMNETEWFSVTVEGVVDKNITGNLLTHFTNGTNVAEDGWVDIDTGDGDNMTFFFISANLNVNDSIYSGDTYSNWTISETIMKTYPGGSRETNHMNMTMEVSMGPSYYMYMSMNVYWDRATGALTEMSIMSNQTMTYTTEWSLLFKLTDTNLWVVPELFGLPQILFLLASLTLVTLIRKRRLHKTQNR